MKKFWQSFSIILLSLLVMALWGSLYPLVKIGYEAFCIDGSDIPSILMFAEPLFACIFSAILLKEDIFQWQYLIAFILISAGIALGNKRKKEDYESKNL
ncbi:MAG: hypothetical protein J6S04_06540 [Clostridia bacterium]|nr:hypothetical protein [Clostridia bacterium]